MEQQLKKYVPDPTLARGYRPSVPRHWTALFRCFAHVCPCGTSTAAGTRLAVGVTPGLRH